MSRSSRLCFDSRPTASPAANRIAHGTLISAVRGDWRGRAPDAIKQPSTGIRTLNEGSKAHSNTFARREHRDGAVRIDLRLYQYVQCRSTVYVRMFNVECRAVAECARMAATRYHPRAARARPRRLRVVRVPAYRYSGQHFNTLRSTLVNCNRGTVRAFVLCRVLN